MQGSLASLLCPFRDGCCQLWSGENSPELLDPFGTALIVLFRRGCSQSIPLNSRSYAAAMDMLQPVYSVLTRSRACGRFSVLQRRNSNFHYVRS